MTSFNGTFLVPADFAIELRLHPIRIYARDPKAGHLTLLRGGALPGFFRRPSARYGGAVEATLSPLPEPLGALEHLVMEAIWAGGSGTVRDVSDRLPEGDARAYTTVMTTLDRLHRKGLLLREKEGLAWRYRAVLTREAWEKALADALASRILAQHGDIGLAAFVDAAADDALLDRLAELVEARRRR